MNSNTLITLINNASSYEEKNEIGRKGLESVNDQESSEAWIESTKALILMLDDTNINPDQIYEVKTLHGPAIIKYDKYAVNNQCTEYNINLNYFELLIEMGKMINMNEDSKDGGKTTLLDAITHIPTDNPSRNIRCFVVGDEARVLMQVSDFLFDISNFPISLAKYMVKQTDSKMLLTIYLHTFDKSDQTLPITIARRIDIRDRSIIKYRSEYYRINTVELNNYTGEYAMFIELDNMNTCIIATNDKYILIKSSKPIRTTPLGLGLTGAEYNKGIVVYDNLLVDTTRNLCIKSIRDTTWHSFIDDKGNENGCKRFFVITAYKHIDSDVSVVSSEIYDSKVGDLIVNDRHHISYGYYTSNNPVDQSTLDELNRLDIPHLECTRDKLDAIGVYIDVDCREISVAELESLLIDYKIN